MQKDILVRGSYANSLVITNYPRCHVSGTVMEEAANPASSPRVSMLIKLFMMNSPRHQKINQAQPAPGHSVASPSTHKEAENFSRGRFIAMHNLIT